MLCSILYCLFYYRKKHKRHEKKNEHQSYVFIYAHPSSAYLHKRTTPYETLLGFFLRKKQEIEEEKNIVFDMHQPHHQTQWAGQPKRWKRKDKARTIANRVGSHSHHVVTIREAPNTLKKMTIWIAPSLFPFTNFVFSITSNSRAKNKKQDAQTVQWSGVGRAHLSHTG